MNENILCAGRAAYVWSKACQREQVFREGDISCSKLTAIQPKSTFKAEGPQMIAFDFKPIKGPPEGLRAVPKPQKLKRKP